GFPVELERASSLLLSASKPALSPAGRAGEGLPCRAGEGLSCRVGEGFSVSWRGAFCRAGEGLPDKNNKSIKSIINNETNNRQHLLCRRERPQQEPV
ncbi:MAG: hypothetical protein SPJ21_05750, partial [Prevotella sp.]|nr:hypothetical protein [Prevotella sp.]